MAEERFYAVTFEIRKDYYNALGDVLQNTLEPMLQELWTANRSYNPNCWPNPAIDPRPEFEGFKDQVITMLSLRWRIHNSPAEQQRQAGEIPGKAETMIRQLKDDADAQMIMIKIISWLASGNPPTKFPTQEDKPDDPDTLLITLYHWV